MITNDNSDDCSYIQNDECFKNDFHNANSDYLFFPDIVEALIEEMADFIEPRNQQTVSDITGAPQQQQNKI